MHGKAREWYEKATTQGLADSQFNLGTMYFLGEGGEKNESFARQWFEKAAIRGDVKAQLNIGILYAEGIDSMPDKNQTRT